MAGKVLKFVNFERDHSVPVTGSQIIQPAAKSATPAEAEAAPAEKSAVDPAVEAETLLAQARRQAETMLAEAQQQIETWQIEASQAGWQQGYEAGQESAKTEWQDTLAAVKALAQSTLEAKELFLADQRDRIGELAVTVAKKIISKEITLNQKAVTDIVGRVLEEANLHGACTIRVNPQDYEILGPLWETIPSMQAPGQKWELQADKRVDRGGCIIEASGGVIDAQLETQLEQVSKAFAKIGGESPSPPANPSPES